MKSETHIYFVLALKSIEMLYVAWRKAVSLTNESLLLTIELRVSWSSHSQSTYR